MRALVVGLARSGVAAGELLTRQGHEVAGVDSGAEREVPFPSRFGTDGLDLLDGTDLLVKSPGVPREAPVVAEALRRGIEVVGELELAWRHLRACRWVAVTGTNGKTTTVELLGHLLRTAGVPVAVAGNVGTPLSSLHAGPETTIVCEASSFQLEDTIDFRPEVAVLLNISPDHLDRHGTMAAYTAAKLRIFANQGAEDVAIAPPGIDLPGHARREHFGPRAVAVPGEHNALNAGAAAAAAAALGVAEDAIEEGLRSFEGVEHRLEHVATIDGVDYVNDSKATNLASTLTALAAFPDRRVHLIAGGRAKGQDLSPLRDARVHAVYRIGEAAHAELAGLGEDCGTLERAVERAAAEATGGDVILLSPACASFDQFPDFEARGRAFKELVRRRRSTA